MKIWDNYGYGAIDFEVIRLLVASGTDVSLKDKLGRTALAYAKQYGQEQVVELLR